MANRGALILLLLIIVLKICTTMGTLVESKAEPVQYISFPPSIYDERLYEVTHNIDNCTSSIVRIDNMNEEVITCPYGELLLDGITQTNLEDDVTNNDIQTFYTWLEDSIPINDAFVTLQFPNDIITPTKVVAYFLDIMELRARESRNFRLYSSSTEGIFPNDEIRDVDYSCVVVKSGITSENDDDYEYIRCDLTINENVSLNYLRIELSFEGMNWIFLSEIEVYHLVPLPTTTSLTTTSSSATSSTMSSITITSSSSKISSFVTSTTKLSSSTVFTTITPTIISDTMSPVSASSSTKSLSLTVSTAIITPTTTILVTAAAIVPSNDNDDNSASVVVISVVAAVTGTSLLVIITLLLVVIMLVRRRRKKSRKVYNIDDNKDVTIRLSSNVTNDHHNPQQYMHNTTDQSQYDFSNNYMLPQGAKASRLETANNLYISTKVKSLDSLLRERHDHNRSISGCDVIMTANPSYVTSTSSLQTRKKSEQEYDYARTDSGLVKHDKFGYLQLVEPAKVTDPTSDNNTDIEVNPSYSLPQDGQNVKLEDNPS